MEELKERRKKCNTQEDGPDHSDHTGIRHPGHGSFFCFEEDIPGDVGISDR